jgi:hypothetical protein
MAEELLGMRSVGRKVARALVDQGERQSLMNLEQSIQNQHSANVASVLSLLSGVTERGWKKSEQSSIKLIRKVSRAQGFTRLETRISKTVAELRDLETRDLVYTKGLPNLEQAQSSILTEKVPRISAIRAVLPEIEPRLRKFVRTSLEDSIGPGWQVSLQAKFPGGFGRWTEKATAKGSTDPLDGQTLGEIIQTIRSYPDLNKLVSSKPEFHLSLNLLSSARRLFIHPLTAPERDIDEDEFRRVMLAIDTVMDSTSGNSRRKSV